MANVPGDLKYSKDHEWVRPMGNGRVRVGITDYAQKQLGDIVFVELPNVGDKFEVGRPFGTVESVKSVSEVYIPMAGVIAAVNEDLNSEPEEINADPYEAGWLIEITTSKAAEMESLLTAAEYEDYLKE